MIVPYFLAFIFIFIVHIHCDDNEPENLLIELDKIYNGTLLSDNSFRYYKLVIPDEIKVNSSDLIFRIKELDSADIGKTDFSDPDIYVSKVYNNTFLIIFFYVNILL